jgi:hypothetical protein
MMPGPMARVERMKSVSRGLSSDLRYGHCHGDLQAPYLSERGRVEDGNIRSVAMADVG